MGTCSGALEILQLHFLLLPIQLQQQQCMAPTYTEQCWHTGVNARTPPTTYLHTHASKSQHRKAGPQTKMLWLQQQNPPTCSSLWNTSKYPTNDPLCCECGVEAAFIAGVTIQAAGKDTGQAVDVADWSSVPAISSTYHWLLLPHFLKHAKFLCNPPHLFWTLAETVASLFCLLQIMMSCCLITCWKLFTTDESLLWKHPSK